MQLALTIKVQEAFTAKSLRDRYHKKTFDEIKLRDTFVFLLSYLTTQINP